VLNSQSQGRKSAHLYALWLAIVSSQIINDFAERLPLSVHDDRQSRACKEDKGKNQSMGRNDKAAKEIKTVLMPRNKLI